MTRYAYVVWLSTRWTSPTRGVIVAEIGRTLAGGASGGWADPQSVQTSAHRADRQGWRDTADHHGERLHTGRTQAVVRYTGIEDLLAKVRPSIIEPAEAEVGRIAAEIAESAAILRG